MLRVMIDGKGCLQVTVKPLHLRGLRIIRGGGNMFNPPRETGITNSVANRSAYCFGREWIHANGMMTSRNANNSGIS
jgi:hypothetical protein